jgi:hypothetical protein
MDEVQKPSINEIHLSCWYSGIKCVSKFAVRITAGDRLPSLFQRLLQYFLTNIWITPSNGARPHNIPDLSWFVNWISSYCSHLERDAAVRETSQAEHFRNDEPGNDTVLQLAWLRQSCESKYSLSLKTATWVVAQFFLLWFSARNLLFIKCGGVFTPVNFIQRICHAFITSLGSFLQRVCIAESIISFVSHMTGWGTFRPKFSRDASIFFGRDVPLRNFLHFYICYSCKHKIQIFMVTCLSDYRLCKMPLKHLWKDEVNRRGQSSEETLHEAVNRIGAGEIGNRDVEQYHWMSVRTLHCRIASGKLKKKMVLARRSFLGK